jgi:hypothetical protein
MDDAAHAMTHAELALEERQRLLTELTRAGS